MENRPVNRRPGSQACLKTLSLTLRLQPETSNRFLEMNYSDARVCGCVTSRPGPSIGAAAADIRAATGSRAVDIFAADMSAQAEVRRLAGAL
jgi:hypothetical protein